MRSDRWKSPIEKYLSTSEKEGLKAALGIEEGDLVILSADANREKACGVLGGVRLLCANNIMKKRERLVVPDNTFNFLWVEDFPLFTPVYSEALGKYTLETTHHPFTAPWPEDIDLLYELVRKVDEERGGAAAFDSIEEIGKIPRGLHYDCVVNGVELGGGSIRIHSEPMQRAVFRSVVFTHHSTTHYNTHHHTSPHYTHNLMAPNFTTLHTLHHTIPHNYISLQYTSPHLTTPHHTIHTHHTTPHHITPHHKTNVNVIGVWVCHRM